MKDLFNIRKWKKDTRLFWSILLACVLIVGIMSIFTPSKAAMYDAASDYMKARIKEDEGKPQKDISTSYNTLGMINYISFSTSGNAAVREAYVGFAGHIFNASTESYRYLEQKNPDQKFICLKNTRTKELTELTKPDQVIRQSEKMEIDNGYRYEYYADEQLVAYRETIRQPESTTWYYRADGGKFTVTEENVEITVTSRFVSNTVVKDQYGTIIYDEAKGDAITLNPDTSITVNGKVLKSGKATVASVTGKLINYTCRLMGQGENWLHGAKLTLLLTTVTVFFGMILGTFLALAKMSRHKWISGPASAYIFFFRGTPLMIQLFVIYFAVPGIFSGFSWAGLSSVESLGAFYAAALAFVLNSGAYCAETVRAAIQSIDKGQHEAAKALGMTYGQTMSLIVLPQSIRRLIPPIANEFIMVLKDASLVFVISLMDISTISKTISSKGDFLVYVPALVLYLIITAFFSFLFRKLEERFAVYE